MRGPARVLRPYLARQWPALALASLASVFSATAELARPFPLKLVIDGLLGSHGGRPFHLGRSDVALLAGVAALVVGIALVDAVASYLVDVRLERAGERIVHDLRTGTYAHLQRLSLRFHDRRPTGDLVTRVTGDVNAVGELFSESLGTVATSSLLLVGMLVVTLFIDPVLALAAFSVTPALAVVTVRFRRRLKATSRRQRAEEGQIASLANEALGAMRVVKSLGSEHFEGDRLARRSEEVQRAGIEVANVEGRFTGVIDVTGAIGSALVLVLGAFRVASGHLSVGDLIVVNSYVRRLYRPLRDIARQASRVSRAMARAERIAEILSADELLPERAGAHDGGRARGEIAFERVTFSYDGGRHPALRELSLRVAAGERVAVVGPSGAGKSTVAALAARFYDPGQGRVLIDGRDVSDCSRDWLRRQVGLVLQDSVLFSGTVAENIGYGIDATPEQVIDAAKAAGAHAFVSELPQGYDTLLGSSGLGLSGGQRQRIAIARTLLRDPPVLVLDEPTTGLDPESEAQVLAGLGVLMRERTVMMITHTMALACTADRVVVVEDGRVVEEGPPAELLGADGTFRRLVTAQGGGDTAAASFPVPRDDALPSLATLLDPSAMASVLHRSLGRQGDAPWPDVRVHCLRYKPGTSMIAHYDVGLDGDWHHATAFIGAGRSLARRAGDAANLALARRVDGRSPASLPLAYDGDLDALIQWLPLDLSLPALAQPPEAWRARLRQAGVRVGMAEPVLLAYKPRRRAVLRLGRHVIKVYADDANFRRAAHGLVSAGAVAGLDTPACVAVLADMSATVQSVVRGRTPVEAGGVAPGAGALLTVLHGSDVAGLETLSPHHQLDEAARSARLAVALVPGLDRRIGHLLSELESSRPDRLALVPSHGDFHARQLLATKGRLALIDLDELCLAPAALDLSTFAAHVVRGGVDDLSAAGTALDALAEGYGERPDGLSWYLSTSILRRAPFPFRYLDDEWPDGVTAQVAAAEVALRW